MRLASIVVTLALVPGCQLWFNGGDDADDDPCVRPAIAEGYSQRLVNPDTLACQTFTQPTCDHQCGPCPGGAIYIPPWGECASPCIGLSESACMADSQCRVARSHDDYYSQWTGVDDYMGCYPLNTGPAPDVERCEGLDAEQCAWQSDCTALYDGEPGQCNAFTPEACIGAAFRQCIPEARTDPGECTPAACRQVPPSCPSGTTPGVANSCYTGACIPTQLCEAIAF
ncbi:MAG: hypothetical protein AB7L94_41920 [Kofleriaceae bacterium]